MRMSAAPRQLSGMLLPLVAPPSASALLSRSVTAAVTPRPAANEMCTFGVSRRCCWTLPFALRGVPGVLAGGGDAGGDAGGEALPTVSVSSAARGLLLGGCGASGEVGGARERGVEAAPTSAAGTGTAASGGPPAEARAGDAPRQEIAGLGRGLARLSFAEGEGSRVSRAERGTKRGGMRTSGEAPEGEALPGDGERALAAGGGRGRGLISEPGEAARRARAGLRTDRVDGDGARVSLIAWIDRASRVGSARRPCGGDLLDLYMGC